MNKENGIATILAIGITVLLLCLALAYITTSLMEKKASSNYQSMVIAKTSTQTAFNRALAVAKDSLCDAQSSLKNLVSHDVNATATPMYYDTLAQKLTTVINSDTYYSLASDYYTTPNFATDTSIPTWIYIRRNQSDTAGDTNEKIIGRMAYVVIPEKNGIEPWTVVDSGENAQNFSKTPPSEGNYGGSNDYTSVDGSGSYVVGRPGRDLTEISLASLTYDSTYFATTYPNKMSVTSSNPEGLVPVGEDGKWKNIEQIFLALNLTSTSDILKRKYFKSVFDVNTPDDPEAFWVDEDSDSIRNGAELYHRFNLTRNDWDDTSIVSVDSILEATDGLAKYSIPGNFNFLPWLNNWKDQGDFPNLQSAKNQMIANLIDYCDSNDTPTSDYDPINNPIPSYVGLEKVPYINRIKTYMDGNINIGVWWTTYASFTTTAPQFTIQLVNAYPENISKNIKIELNYHIRIQYGTTVPYTTYSFLKGVITYYSEVTWGYLEKDIVYTSDAFVFDPGKNDHGYYSKTFTIPNSYLNSSHSLNNTSDLLWINYNISNISVKVIDADNQNVLYDYVKAKGEDDTYNTLVYRYPNKNQTKDIQTITLGTRDPKENQFETNWEIIANNSQELGNNSNFNPNPGGNSDPEPSVNYPNEISTAYIRNAPMKSPWELGFIHRTREYQTLNLKKYNTSEGVSPEAGGNSYADGDANILDQVKMTTNDRTEGKINIDSTNQSVIRSLFDHISVGSEKTDPGKENAVLDVSDANTIADVLINVTKTTPFNTRAEILSNSDISTLLSTGNGTKNLSTKNIQKTDATQEEIIGKFINLAKAEGCDKCTIIVVGEAIQDIGTKVDKNGNPINGQIGQFDINSDEILSSQKIKITIQRDAASNKFYITDIMYLGE